MVVLWGGAGGVEQAIRSAGPPQQRWCSPVGWVGPGVRCRRRCRCRGRCGVDVDVGVGDGGCQVYDPDERGVVGLRVRPHLLRSAPAAQSPRPAGARSTIADEHGVVGSAGPTPPPTFDPTSHSPTAAWCQVYDRRRTQRRRRAGPTPPPDPTSHVRRSRPSAGARSTIADEHSVVGVRVRRHLPTPPPTFGAAARRPRGARSTTPTNTASSAPGSDPTSQVRPLPPKGHEAGRCQVYDADEHSVAGLQVRPHLPGSDPAAR